MGTIKQGAWLDCSYCGNSFYGSPQQVGAFRNGKNVFCCAECRKKYKAERSATGIYNSHTPWHWLNVPHCLDFLPTEEPPEIWVGY